MRRSCHFACECAETAHGNKGDKARIHRIIWDHFMHGGNAKKLGLNEGHCNLCRQSDSAKHWLTECKETKAAELRQVLAEEVEQHVATLGDLDYNLQHFVRILATYVTRHEDGYMHKVGMIPHARLAEIGEHLGLATVCEELRANYYTEALRLGTVLMDGVLREYVHKKSNGRKDAARQILSLRLARKTRKELAERKSAEKKRKRLNKPKVQKQLRITEYIHLGTSSYGMELRDPQVFGSEDGRRMEAGIG